MTTKKKISMPKFITIKYIKSMINSYKLKEYNEFSEEELDDLEKIMCDGLEDKDD